MKSEKLKQVSDYCLRQWRNNPLFSTGVALAVMVILQTLALGFHEATLGEWLSSFCTNWFNILRNNATVGIVALGMTYVIVSGGIDLAVGSTLCMTGAWLLMLTDEGGLLSFTGLHGGALFVLAFLLVILMGMFLGWVNGVLIANGGIPSFIVTLGTMKLYRSITQYVMQGRTPVFPVEFLEFASLRTGSLMVMPILYFLLMATLLHFLYRNTVFGTHVVAIGSNEKAAKLAGIHIKAVKRKIYVLASALVAFAAIIQVCRIGSMDYSNAGSGYEMDAIAAVIVGGTRMSGGRGSIIGTVLGVLIIAVMNNLLNLLGVPPFLREAFKGLVVIVAVLLQRRERL